MWGNLVTTGITVIAVVAAMVYYWGPQSGPAEPAASVAAPPTVRARTAVPPTPTVIPTPLPDGAVVVGRFTLLPPGHEAGGCSGPVRAEWVATAWSVTDVSSFLAAPSHALLVEPEGLPERWTLNRVVEVTTTGADGSMLEGTVILHYIDGGEKLTVIRQSPRDPCRVAFGATELSVEPRVATLIDLAGRQVALIADEPTSVSFAHDGVRTIVEGHRTGSGSVIVAAEAVLRAIEE